MSAVVKTMVEIMVQWAETKLIIEAIKKLPDDQRLKFFDDAFEAGYISINPFHNLDEKEETQ